MDKSYKRSEDIDAKIQTVKLSYNAWRTLFLLDDETTVPQLVELLKEDNEVIEKAVQRLLEENLITEAKEEKAEEQAQTEAEPAIVDEPVVEEPAPLPETAMDSEEESDDVFEEEEAAGEDVNLSEELVEPEKPADADEPEEAEPEIADLLEEELVAETMPQEVDQADEEIVLEEITEEIQPTPEQEDFAEKTDEPDQPAADEEIDIKIDDESNTESDMLDVDFAAPDTSAAEMLVSEEEVPDEKPIAVPEPAPAPSGDRKTILVVDDSIVIRKMVEIALEEEDFNIETAVSGKDGLDKIDKVNPSLIILDLMLPDINGIDILKTVKASRKIPVIMLSGKDSPQMVENAKTAGADAFLPKPFKDDELKDQIHKLLNG